MHYPADSGSVFNWLSPAQCPVPVVSRKVEAHEVHNQVPHNHALQRTRHDVVVCNPRVPCAGSLSLGRYAALIEMEIENEQTN